jgi:hypothetical protein
VARHVRIGEHDGRPLAARLVEPLVVAARADVRELGAAEGDVRDLLHRRAVIDAQNNLAHLGTSPKTGSARARVVVAQHLGSTLLAEGSIQLPRIRGPFAES